MSKNLKFMCEVAIFTALGIVLDYFAGLYSDPLFPNGGSIGIAMIPIFIMSYRWGLKGGLCTGLAIGVIQTFYGGNFVHWAQIFLDYWGAYTVVGFSGAFAKMLANAESKKKKSFVVAGSILFGAILRLACATASGVIFFADYAPEGMAPFAYSLGYNALYIIPSAILCAAILIVLVFKAPFVFEAKEEFKSISNEQIYSTVILCSSIMAVILFSGKFIYKYDSDWNKILSSHVTGFDAMFGTSSSYLVGENYVDFKLAPNAFALIIGIALVLVAALMFVPNKYFKVKTITSTSLLSISFILSFFMKSSLLNEVNKLTNNTYNFKAFYPMNLVIVILGVLAVANLGLTIYYFIKGNNKKLVND